jgi:hypothetical protein
LTQGQNIACTVTVRDAGPHPMSDREMYVYLVQNLTEFVLRGRVRPAQGRYHSHLLNLVSHSGNDEVIE